MCQGFFGYRNVDGQYWTLHVELCFYLLMAGIYAAGARDYVVPILFALAILGLLNSLGGWGSEWPGVWRLERAWPLRRHLMFFLFGILVYKAREGLTARTAMWLLLTASVLLTVESRRMVVLVTGLFCLGLWLPASGRWMKPLLFLGTISYSLYLIHANVGYALIAMAYRNGVPPQVSVPVVLLFILLIATGVTFLVERPAARLLRNYRRDSLPTALPNATPS